MGRRPAPTGPRGRVSKRLGQAARVRDSGAALEEELRASGRPRPLAIGRSIGSTAIRIVVLLAGLQLWLSGCAATHEARDWVVVASPRFEIYSTLAVEDSKALIRQLEQFHALVGAVTNARVEERSVPTRMFVFADESDYRPLGPADTAGAFIPGLRQSWILTSDRGRSFGALEVVLHEYVHQVLRAGTNRPYPIWYDEGMAELFSTVEPRGELLAIGSVPKRLVGWFQYGEWLPLERVISTRTYGDLESDERGMFYAQSWALVHYLTLDREAKATPVSVGLNRYLDLLELGISPVPAFESAFGESPDRVGKNVRQGLFHRKIQVVGFPIAKLAYDRIEPTARAPQPGEVALRMGELQLARRKFAEAEQEFRSVLAAVPGDARAHAGLGSALKDQSKVDEAETFLRRAVSLAPDDPLNHLDLADLYLGRAHFTVGPIDAMREELVLAREHIERAIELDASSPEAWTMLGATYLAAGEDPARAMPHLLKAFQRLPSSPIVLGFIAEVHLARGDELQARDFLRRMVSARGDAAGGYSVDEIVDQIRRRRAAAAKRVGLDESKADRS